jgi:DNA-binding CsgD family transcriptional regulator/PAS domain-containing protein
MMRDHQRLSLIGQIYDAALDASQWPSVLSALTRAFNANTACLFQQDFVTGAGCPLGFTDLTIDSFNDYAAYYWKKDIWSLHPDRHAAGEAYIAHSFVSDRDILRSEFYHDFMRPNRLFHALGSLPLIEGHFMYLLGLHRPKRGGQRFREDQRRSLQLLVPHIRRALQIHHRFEQATVQREAIEEATDHLTRGIFTFDTTGRLLWCNRIGEAICDQADGLMVQRGQLVAALSDETRRLHQLIGEALCTSNGHGTASSTGSGQAAGGAMLVSRSSGRRPYILLVSPLRAGRGPFDDRQPALVVFVSDPERASELPANRLSRLYGLTQAETQLTLQLAGGHDLREIAAASQRTMNTVRSQLKQVFQKTGVKRQAQLVRLVLQIDVSEGQEPFARSALRVVSTNGS